RIVAIGGYAVKIESALQANLLTNLKVGQSIFFSVKEYIYADEDRKKFLLRLQEFFSISEKDLQECLEPKESVPATFDKEKEPEWRATLALLKFCNLLPGELKQEYRSIFFPAPRDRMLRDSTIPKELLL
ncbi:MAG: hypothetical protein JWO53_80, partial [Chlamydiia bacterium]|nr:hypothetical protein [Chlamydiia bacterium]